MVYDRFQLHQYKYVLGVIDVYSRYVSCRPLTNMRMETIMEKLQDIFDNDLKGYPQNINCDQQFNNKEFVDFFTEKGAHLWFSQPEQPHKNAIIERFWRTLALLLQRMREGIKSFDWAKALPDVVANYNSEYNRSIKATPKQVFEGKKENPIQRKVVESVLEVGMKVRIKHQRGILEKGDVRTFSKEIYQIIAKKGKKNTLKNLTTGEELKRTYTDEELTQTFTEPVKKKVKSKENAGERPRIIEREIEVAPVLDEQEQQQREQRIRRKLRREGISY